MKCINVDWLQLFGILDNEEAVISLLEKAGFFVKDNERGTRHFEKWVTVYTPNKKHQVAQICYKPFSVKGQGEKGIFHPGSCTVQLCNKYCYAPDPIGIIGKICEIIKFKFRSISRLDLCLDFHKFDNGMKPATLIRGFFTGKYWKMGYRKALSVGVQNQLYDPETLSFKGKNSAVSTKIYDKTKELHDVHEKPYIRDAWKGCGLDDKKTIWRLEVCIKSDGRTIVDIGSGEIVKFGLSDIKSTEQRLFIFFVMVKKFFHWRYNNGETRKARAKDVELFNIDQNTSCWKPTKITETRDYGKKYKMLVNSIYEIINQETEDEDAIYHLKMTALYLQREFRLMPDILKDNNVLKNNDDG